jgi:hypothetical protein
MDRTSMGSCFQHDSAQARAPERYGPRRAMWFLVLALVTTALTACADADPAKTDTADTTLQCPVGAVCVGTPCLAEQFVPDGKLDSTTKFGPEPWGSCGQSVKGQYGVFTIAAPGANTLVFHNDWLLRSGKNICGTMFNLFEFSTGNGTQQWEVKVFGDGHIEVLLNGAVHIGAKGGYFFGPSALEPEPHTQFEFYLEGVAAGELAQQLHDPASPPMLLAEADDPTPGCDDPVGALVREPTVLRAQIGGGLATMERATTPTAVVLDANRVSLPATVVVYGGGFGTNPGTVTADWKAVQVVEWKDTSIRIVLGATASKEVRLVVHVPGQPPSNALSLYVVSPVVVGPGSGSGPDPDPDVDPPSFCQVAGNDGKSCENECFLDSVCKDGQCVGTLDACPTAQPCYKSTCANGWCHETPDETLNGQACGTATACFAGSVCRYDYDNMTEQRYWGWGCFPTAPINCNDGSVCTFDSCDSVNGCQYDPLVCEDDGACLDGTCDPKTGCVKITTCDDGDACTDAWCKKGVGCQYSAKTCVGFGPCTATCGLGGLCTIDPGQCSDGDPCTTDSCNAGYGCSYLPILCNDFNPCTNDACDNGQCGSQPVPDKTTCPTGQCYGGECKQG